MRLIQAIKAVGLIDGVRGYLYTTQVRKAQVKRVEQHLKALKDARKRDRAFIKLNK